MDDIQPCQRQDPVPWSVLLSSFLVIPMVIFLWVVIICLVIQWTTMRRHDRRQANVSTSTLFDTTASIMDEP